MEERLPIWKVAAKLLNKQSRTADKGWSSRLELSELLTTALLKNISCYVSLQEKPRTRTDSLVRPKQRKRDK
jgi:hypothetical protein